MANSKDNKRKQQLDTSTLIYGKVPPQSRELEEAVLGAIMLDKTAFDEISDILKPESFYVEVHQIIFRVIQDMKQKGIPVDIMTVVEELKKREQLELVGGPYYVTKLTNSVVSSANIEAHAKGIIEKFIKRQIIKSGGESVILGYDDTTDPFELLDKVEAEFFAIRNSFTKKNFENSVSLAAKALNKVDELMFKKEDVSGVPSGFPSLDKITYGWQPTDLIILAARPAVGKTAFALNLARNACNNSISNTPVGFFSLEMSAGQLVNRILSAESKIHLEKIQRGKLEDFEYAQFVRDGVGRYEKMEMYIDDTAALNIFEFRAKARRMVNKHNVGLIIVDYLQLMQDDSYKGNREQQISSISRNLKTVAKELNIPIIALSQLSRGVEGRTVKVPQLSDLRESGAIEQDADMVMFIYRPEYYEVTSDSNGESTSGLTEIKIAKHRNGDLGTVRFQAQLWIQNFVEMQDNNSMPSNWKPLSQAMKTASTPFSTGKGDFDEGFEEQPF